MDELKANPQFENGFLRIANELIIAMARYPFNGSEFRIVIAVIKKTDGWHKRSDVIPFSQISSFTNLNLRYVKKLVKRLSQDNVLFKEPSPNGNSLSLNKNYYGWRLWKTPDPSNRIDTRGVSNLSPKEVSNFIPKPVSKKTPSKEKKEK